MTETFAPEDVKARNPDGRGYSDLYMLTAAQVLGTLSALHEINPESQLKPSDVCGYIGLQYDIAAEFVTSAFEMAKSPSHRDGELQSLHDLIPRVLGDRTRNALMHRLRLGSPKSSQFESLNQNLDEELYGYFDQTTNENYHGQPAPDLTPLPGVRLSYLGNIATSLADVAFTATSQSQLYTDLMKLEVEGDDDRYVVSTACQYIVGYGLTSLRLI